MSSCSRGGGSTPYPRLDRTPVLRALVPADRRRIVSALLDWPTPVDERALAAQLVADAEDEPVPAVAESEAAASLHGVLQHVHLPALVEAGLVTWDRVAGTVAPTDHPGLRDPLIRRFVRTPTDESEDVVDALADRRRQTVLAVLQVAPEPMTTAELSRDVALRALDPSVDRRDVTVSLQHVHLPKLDDAGLIDYDRETDTVTYRGHPAIEGPWFGWWEPERADTGTSSGGDTTNNDPQ